MAWRVTSIGRAGTGALETAQPRDDMKIAIVGTGAMGSVYAGLLGKAGHEVWAIDIWQEHIDAIAASGSERLRGQRSTTSSTASTSDARRTMPGPATCG